MNLLAALVLSAVAPHTSLTELVSSNGSGTLGYSLPLQKFDSFIQHTYQQESANTPTRNLMVDSYFGARFLGQPVWFSQLAVQSYGYVTGTNVFSVNQSWSVLPGVTFATYGFAPRALNGAAYVMALQVTNTTGADISGLELFSLHNQVVNADRPIPTGTGEFVYFDNNMRVFVEEGGLNNSGAAAVYLPLNQPSRRTSGGSQGTSLGSWTTNPFNELINRQVDFTDAIDAVAPPSSTPGNPPGSYNDDNIAVGYQWQNLTVPAGQSIWIGVGVSTDEGSITDQAFGLLHDWLSGVSDAGALVQREIAAWPTVSLPAAMPADEQALYSQSLAVLEMAAVKESDLSTGQIVASISAATSNDANQWNITWARDMAYSVVALSEAGHFATARAALQFEMQANANTFQTYVGKPYQVSVCRYFGDGSEWSDANSPNGYNIEFDGFGLFLWSLGRYVALSGDTGFLREYWAKVAKPLVADVLVNLIEPYSGLIQADSSIWEVHWNGQQKQFTYTSLAAVAGLCAAGDLAEAAGDKVNALHYRNTARSIRASIQNEDVDPKGILAGSFDGLRVGKGYIDASVVEAWGMNLFSGTASFAQPTAGGLQVLSLPSGGYFRNEDGGAYDNQEWVFVDLRYASGVARLGTDTTSVYRWVVEQSAQNANLIAELYDKQTADYAGSVPMVGFGAGAFVLAADRRYSLSPDPIPCGSYDNTIENSPTSTLSAAIDATSSTKKKGCSASGSPWVIVMAAAWLFKAKMSRNSRRT